MLYVCDIWRFAILFSWISLYFSNLHENFTLKKKKVIKRIFSIACKRIPEQFYFTYLLNNWFGKHSRHVITSVSKHAWNQACQCSIVFKKHFSNKVMEILNHILRAMRYFNALLGKNKSWSFLQLYCTYLEKLDFNCRRLDIWWSQGQVCIKYS